MKKNILFISIALVSILFLVSCTTTAPKSSTGFIGGTDGLSATFITDQPPAKVYDDNTNPFTIALTIENKGEHDVQPNELLTTIDGIDYTAFQIANPNQRNSLRIGKVQKDSTGAVLPGDKNTDISYDASYKDKVAASSPYSIGMNICYNYQSDALSKVCLRNDVTARPGPKDVCMIEGNRIVSSSGAPIQITTITERPSGKNQVELIIEFENKGKGEVYDPSFLSKGTCLTDIASGLQNKVHAKVFFQDATPSINCKQLDNTNEGTVRLVTNKQRLDCTIDTGSIQATTFEKDLNVALTYVYKDYISTQILIDKSLQ